MSVAEKQLTGIRPDELYSEQRLRQEVEISAIRRAKRDGMPFYRIGRQVWIKGEDLIAHFTRSTESDSVRPMTDATEWVSCRRCGKPIPATVSGSDEQGYICDACWRNEHPTEMSDESGE